MAARLTEKDWLAIGLEQVKTVGAAGLTIEALCGKAGRSKGSFYHHFQDADDFARKLMTRWERDQTDGIVAAQPPDLPPAEALAWLDDQAVHLDLTLERAIRIWASGTPALRDALARVDSRRIKVLADLYAQVRPEADSDARRRALIDYAAFLGFLELADLHPDMRADAPALSGLLRRVLLIA